MTDDLVERLLDWPYQGETMAHEAADRIEQLEKELSTCRMAQVVMDNTVAKLTAERNKYESAWMTAEGKLADVEAERDRFRKVLKGLMAHEPDYSDTLWQDARAALKGETP